MMTDLSEVKKTGSLSSNQPRKYTRLGQILASVSANLALESKAFE
jgi:hypothetical protein